MVHIFFKFFCVFYWVECQSDKHNNFISFDDDAKCNVSAVLSLGGSWQRLKSLTRACVQRRWPTPTTKNWATYKSFRTVSVQSWPLPPLQQPHRLPLLHPINQQLLATTLGTLSVLQQCLPLPPVEGPVPPLHTELHSETRAQLTTINTHLAVSKVRLSLL